MKFTSFSGSGVGPKNVEGESTLRKLALRLLVLNAEAKMKIKSRYTTQQILRFPLLFGAILGTFVLGFMYRKVYFGDEIEAVRQKNWDDSVRRKEIMERAKQAASEELVKSRGKSL